MLQIKESAIARFAHALCVYHNTATTTTIQAMDDRFDEVYLTDEAAVVEKASRIKFSETLTIRGPLLADVSNFDHQQKLVTKDVIYAICSFEGFYVRYSSRYQRDNLDHRIRGPDFITAKKLDVSLKQVVRKLLRFGKYVGGITAFLDHYDDCKFGKGVQSLCEQISIFLDDYHQAVLEIEYLFSSQVNFSLNSMENFLNQKIANKLYHLYEICNAIHDESCKRAKLTIVNDQSTLNEMIRLSLVPNQVGVDFAPYRYCKGSLVLLIVQERILTFKGDTHLLHYLNHLFDSILRDYVSMLNNWLSDGLINDPFNEFMIKQGEVGPVLSDDFAVTSEKYWTELFLIRKDGLISQLMSFEIQRKILNTGILLNMFKQCTGIHNFLSIDVESLVLIDLLVLDDLELKIDSFYRRANTMMLKLFYDGYSFDSLLWELQNRFMLMDCFPSEQFIDRSFHDLKQKKKDVSVSSLKDSYRNLFGSKGTQYNESSTWERPQITVADIVFRNQQFGISKTNLFDEILDIKEMEAFDPTEIMKDGRSHADILNFALGRGSTLRSSLVAASENFNLADYTICLIELKIPLPFPYNFIIDTNLLFQYGLVFRFLMLVRFLNHYNQDLWKELNLLRIWRSSTYPKPVTTILRRCRDLNLNIAIFLEQLMGYLNIDVVNYNYLKLLKASSAIHEEVRNHRMKLEQMLNIGSSRTSLSDRHFDRHLFTSFKSPNSALDSVIRSQKSTLSGNTQQQELRVTVEELQNQINRYLGNIINDSFLPCENIMSSLKKLFELINLANSFFKSLDSKLPTSDPEQYKLLQKQQPEIHPHIDLSEESIRRRYLDWNKTVTEYMDNFNSQIHNLCDELQKIEEFELKLALILRERLKLAFNY